MNFRGVLNAKYQTALQVIEVSTSAGAVVLTVEYGTVHRTRLRLSTDSRGALFLEASLSTHSVGSLKTNRS